MNRKTAANVTIKRNILIALLMLMVLLGADMIYPAFSYADNKSEKVTKEKQENESDSEDDITEDMSPVREVHKVKVKNKQYCFFVDQNVVLTPTEISAMTDEKLVATVIVRSGLYMKKSNCTDESNTVITPADWMKKGGTFWLDRADIKQLREASPKKGVPIKLSMDLKISTEQESKKAAEERKKEAAEAAKVIEIIGKDTENQDSDSEKKEAEIKDIEKDIENENKEVENRDIKNDSNEDEQKKNEDYSTPRVKFYSTYRKTEEPLFFVVVATAADAKQMPAYCEEFTQPEKEEKIAPEPSEPSEPEEILPEYRTINMTDRSGAPVEPVLQDGKPVGLTWEDPQRSSAERDGHSSVIDAIPGGVAGLVAVFSLLLLGTIALIKRYRSKE